MKIRVFQAADEAAVFNLWVKCGLVVPWTTPTGYRPQISPRPRPVRVNDEKLL